MRSTLALLPALPLALGSPLLSVGTIHNGAAPVLSSTNSEHIPDSYMVVFKSHVSDRTAAAHHSWVQDLHESSQTSRAELRKRSQFPILDTVYEGLKHSFDVPGGLLGYSGHFDDTVLEEIRRHPDVRRLCLGIACILSSQAKLTSQFRSITSKETRSFTP